MAHIHLHPGHDAAVPLENRLEPPIFLLSVAVLHGLPDEDTGAVGVDRMVGAAMAGVVEINFAILVRSHERLLGGGGGRGALFVRKKKKKKKKKKKTGVEKKKNRDKTGQGGAGG